MPGGYYDPAHPFYRFESCLGLRPAYTSPLPSAYEFARTPRAEGLPSLRWYRRRLTLSVPAAQGY